VDIKDYISSGILEAYVLGSLSSKEVAEVEIMSANHPEVKKELRAIEDALFHYAQKYSKEPPVTLKARIFTSIDNGGRKEPKIIKEKKAIAEVKIPKEQKIEEPVKVIPANARKSKAPVYMMAASIAFALLCAFAALVFWQKWQKAEQKILALQKETLVNAEIYSKAKYSLVEKIKSNSSQLSSVEKELQMLLDTNMKTVILTGMPISPESSALVFWKKDSKEVFIDVKSLPQPPPDMQYQLWALEKGEMVDAGVFEIPDSLQFQKLKVIKEATAFAVTLEKRGGSESPNTEAVYVKGNI
jgi:anti-sigma-K factor RskA